MALTALALLSPSSRRRTKKPRKGDVMAPAAELAVPHEWQRELYDDMRELGGECGRSCPAHPRQT